MGGGSKSARTLWGGWVPITGMIICFFCLMRVGYEISGWVHYSVYGVIDSYHGKEDANYDM